MADTKLDDHPAAAVASASSSVPTDPMADTKLEDSQPVAGRGELAPGSRIDRFVIEERLGAGAMGVVYAARDPELDRPIAIKLLRATDHADGLRTRLYREAQALARVAHPNVVVVHEVGSHGSQVYVAMELVRGGTLRDWLAGDHTTEEILRVLGDAGRGLAAAHDANLIHRDFKPDNVLIGEDGRPRVTDFGLARFAVDATADQARPLSGSALPVSLDEPVTQTGALLGTPLYSSIEQLEGTPLAATADQFSFCVTAYEALYGVRPFDATTLGQLLEQVAAGPPAAPPPGRKVPRRVHRALLRGMSPSASERFPSMSALLAELTPATPRSRWIALGSGAVVVAAAAVAYAALHEPAAMPTCADEAAVIAQTWNPTVAAELRKRLSAASKYGDRLATSIDAKYRRYTDDWAALRTSACTAQRHGDAAAARSLKCLDARRHVLTSEINEDLGKREINRIAPFARLLEPVATCAHPAPDSDFFELMHWRQQYRKIVNDGVNKRDLDGLLNQLDQLADQLEPLGYPPIRAEVLLELANQADNVGNHARAEATLHKVLAIAEPSRDAQSRLAALATLAIVLTKRNQADEAARLLELVDPIIAGIGGDPLLEATIAEARGYVAFQRGDFNEAIQQLTTSIAITEELSYSHAEILDPGRKLVEAYAKLGRESDAQAALAHVRKYFPHTRDPRDTSRSDTSAANADDPGDCGWAVRRGEFDRAMAVCTEWLTQSERKYGATWWPNAIGHQALGIALQARGDYRGALTQFLASAAIWDTHGDQLSVAQTTARAGQQLYQLGEPAAAIVQYRRSVAVAAALGKPGEEQWIYSRAGLGRALSAAHQDAEAITELTWALPRLEIMAEPRRENIAEARLALADALWRRSPGDRDRARRVASSAHDDAIAARDALDPNDPITPFLRKRIAKLAAQIEAWQSHHR